MDTNNTWSPENAFDDSSVGLASNQNHSLLSLEIPYSGKIESAYQEVGLLLLSPEETRVEEIPLLSLWEPSTSVHSPFLSANQVVSSASDDSVLLQVSDVTATDEQDIITSGGLAFSQFLTVPGELDEQVTLNFTWTDREAAFNNEVGLFKLNGSNIDGLEPSEPQYAATALSDPSRQVIFSSGQTVGASKTLIFQGGDQVAFYLIQNDTTDNWLEQNSDNSLQDQPVAFLSLDAANPDGLEHVTAEAILDGGLQFSWEDLAGLENSDRDFNDVIFSVSEIFSEEIGILEKTPGTLSQLITTTFFWTERDAGFDNELGIFLVDDAQGRIGALSPGDAGYQQVALASERRRIVFESGQTAGAVKELSLPGDTYFGWYLVQNASTQQFLAENPNNELDKGPLVFFSLPETNPDGFEHLKAQQEGLYGWEDLVNGGDQDFNDLVFRYSFEPPTPITNEIFISDLEIIEGPNSTARFEVTLSAPSTEVASVEYEVVSGTATADEDFIAQTGQVTFHPGETTQSIDVSIIDDTTVEAEEHFSVNLSAVVNATIADSQGIGTILDNDEAAPTNDPPVISAPDTIAAIQGTPLVLSDIGISDIDVGNGDLRITVSAENGLLSLSETAGITFVEGQSSGAAKLVFTGQISAVNAAIDTLSYLSELSAAGSDKLTIVVDDLGNTGEGGPLTDEAAIDINVSVPNSPPVVDENKSVIIREDSAPVSLEVSAPSDPDQDPLNIVVSSVPDATKGSVVLADGTTVQVGQQFSSEALTTWRYDPLPDVNGDAGDFSYTVDDGQGGSATQTISLEISPVNDAPVLTVPDALATTSGAELAISGISVEDVDAENGDIQIALTVDEGVLSLGTTTGISFETGDGTDDASLRFTGRLDNVNAALATLSYRSENNFDGAATIQLTVNDQGNTGEGGALSDRAEITIAVTDITNANTIAGTVFVDENSNAQLDAAEAGQAGVNVFLDLNRNGFLNADEPFQTTDSDGKYRFENAPDGDYIVWQQTPVGFEQTAPDTFFKTVELDGDDTLDGVDFGNAPFVLPTGTSGISGFKWEDINESGTLDLIAPGFGEEPGLEGFTIYLDLNQNAQLDPNEPTQLTAADGSYSFTDLAAGTYDVREVQQSGFTSTFPAAELMDVPGFADPVSVPKAQQITVGEGEAVEEVNFGNRKNTGEIRGRKWEDVDGDGVIDTDEQGIEDVTVYLDLNENGQIDLDEPTQQTDADGRFRFRDLSAGDYTVREITPLDFQQTFPVNTSFQAVEVGVGEIVENVNFGNQRIAPPVANRPPEFISTPITTGTEGEEYTYQPVAADPDNDALTFTLVDGPVGLTIAPETGLLLWEPTEAQLGTASVTIQVSDEDGLTDIQTFEIEVQGRTSNGAPVFISDPVTDFAIAVSNPATGNVSPELISLSLDSGETTTETISLVLPTGGTSTGGQADVVFIVDESGSMSTEQAWLTDMVLELDSALEARGIDDNRYSLIGYTNQTRLFNLAAQAEVALYGPGNQLIDSGSFDSIFNNPQLDFELAGDGVYTIVVTPIGDAAPVTFNLNAAFTDASAIALTNFNTPFTSTVAPQAEETFTFDAPAGSRVFFDGLASSADSIRARLIDAQGNIVFSNRRLNQDNSPQVLSEGGTYSLVVSGGSAGGEFSFQLLELDAAATDINLDTQITGAIAALQTEVFQFDAAAGEQIYFDSASNPFVTANLYGPDSQFINGRSSLRDFTAQIPTDGTYTLLLQSNSDSLVDYDFSLITSEIDQTTAAIGEAIAGTLSEVGEQDIYRIEGSAGQRIILDGLGADSTSIVARLVSPTGTQVFGNTSATRDTSPVILPETGAYSLVVSGGETSGDYRFQLLDLNADATDITTEVTSGSEITTTFANGQQTELYRFDGSDGQQLVFDAVSSTGFGNWQLYGPDNARLSTASISTDFSAVLPTDGTYTLLLDGDSSGPFEATFRAANQIIEESTLSLGTPVSGSLENPGEQDVYRFSGSAGQRIWFDGLTSDSFSIDVRAAGPGGQVLFSRLNADGDAGPITLPEAGDYVVVVNGTNTTGDYSFRVLDLGAAEAITIGTDISGSLTPGTQTQLYTFDGAAGQELLFDVLAADSFFTSSWSLYGPVSNKAIASNRTLDDFTAVLPTDGTYTLIVDGNSSESVINYSFNVNDVSASASVTPSGFDTIRSGTLAAADQADSFTFEAAAGDRIFFDGLTSASSNIRAQLTAPSGESLFSSVRLTDDVGELTLPEAGTYSVTVSTSGALGDYSFRILNLDDAEVLPIDTVFNGTLAEGNGTDVYQFTGTAGQQLFFDGISADGTGTLRLYGPENRQLAESRLTRDFSTTLSADGTYIVLLDGGDAAPFDFSLQVVTPETQISPLTLGETVSASSTEPGEQDVYRFSGAAGQRLWFDGLGSSGFSANARLVSPTGVEVLSNTRSDRDSSPFVLPESGEYSLIVTAGDQADDYSFRLLDLAASATTINLDTVISDTLTPGLGTQIYEFTGSAGQELFFNALSNSDTINWTLFGPNNAELGSDFFPRDFSVALPADATYTLVLDGNGAAPIDFSFEVVAAATQTTTIDYGTVVEGALSQPGETDIYQFTGVAGQQIWFDGLAADVIEIDAALVAPSGDRLFNRLDVSRDSATPFTLFESGTYSVVINSGRDNPGSTTGAYRFQILEITAQVPDSGEITGTFAQANTAQIFQFDATGGQQLTITPDEAAFFGTAAEFSNATAFLSTSQGGTEDGYLGIDTALQLPFRDGAAKNIVLVTDEDRDIFNADLTFDSILADLTSQDAPLNAVINAVLSDGSGTPALGVDSTGTAYIADGAGGFISTPGGVFGAPGDPGPGASNATVETDYVDLAWASEGAAWDLNQLRAGGDAAVSFTKAFVEVKAEEISQQLSIDLLVSDPNANVQNLTGPLQGINPGETASFDVQITGDRLASDFDIAFVRPDTGFVLGSIPVAINQGYFYLAQAVDPDEDPLTYSLIDAPTGATIDPTSGRIDWIPPGLGTYQFEVGVADDRGAQTTQIYEVEVVAPGGENTAPTITSIAPDALRVGEALTYQLTASDPEGDPLTFLLTEAPEGMAIAPDTGLLTWTPTEAQTGEQTIEVQVVDGQGGSGTQRFALTVSENQAPEFTSTPFLGATPEQPYEYDVDATDPEGTAISYRLLSSAPEGMTIDPVTGVIEWTPRADQAGQVPITVVAEDAEGERSLQTFLLNVGSAGGGTGGGPGGGTGGGTGEIPVVSLGFNSNVVEIGEDLNLQVRAVDNESIVALELVADGQVLSLTPGDISSGAINEATAQFNQAGIVDVLATATDNDGNVGTQSLQVRVVDPNDTEAPFIEIDTSQFTTGSAQLDTTLESLTDIIGTVRDDNLEFFRLEIAPIEQAGLNSFTINDPNYTVLAEGNRNIIDDALGAVDPRKFANGSYFVRAIAGDFSGNVNVQGIGVSLDSAEKPGQVRLEINDLTIPVAGIPIEITRVYDSFEANESGDFGFGWSLKAQEANIEESVPVTDGPNSPALFTATSFRAGDTVTLTNPDGERVSFIFDPVLTGASIFGAIWQPRFTPAPGVFDRLEVDDINITQKADGSFGLLFISFPYNPTDYRLITKDGTEYSYNQFDGLQSVKDRNGNTLTYTEDGIFSSTGESITFSRDEQGRIVSITDPAGATIQYGYNADDDLATVTEQSGLTFTHTYSSGHLLDEVIDPLGNAIAATQYDQFGRITASTDALGNTTTIGYEDNPDGSVTETRTDALGNTTVVIRDERGNVTVSTDEVGATTTTAYNADEVLIQTTNALGDTVTRTVDERGNILSVTDELGNTQSFTYDAFGNVLTDTDPLGRVTTFTYNENGNVTTITDPTGAITRFEYDEFGRVVRFIDANDQVTEYGYTTVAGGAIAQAQSKPTRITFPDGSIQTFTYDQFGQLTSRTDENGNTTQLIRDSSGRLISEIDPLGNTTTYEYELDRTVAITDATGQTTRFEYNDAGQLIRQITPEGSVTEFGYDALGRQITESVLISASDPSLKRTTTTTYRADGLVAAVTEPDGSTTRFEYDLVGNQTAVIDPLGNRTERVYDAAGNRIRQIDPLGAITTFSYNAVNNLAETVDRNNRRRTFEYDPLDQLIQERWWNGDTVIEELRFNYDAVGNLTLAGDSDSTIALAYNSRDRVEQVDYINTLAGLSSVTLSYDYDGVGNITGIEDSFGVRTDLAYDARNLLTQQSWQGNGIADAQVQYEYNSRGENTLIKRYSDLDGNELVSSSALNYDNAGRLTGIEHLDEANAALVEYAYSLNIADEIIQVMIDAQTTDYDYDATGQLTDADKSGTTEDETYRYDANGNRLSASSPGIDSQSAVYTVDAANRITSDGTFNYQYDGEGNLILRTEIATNNTRTFEWDHRNRLAAVVEITNGTEPQRIEYTYDALDRRIAESIDGETTFLLSDGSALWSEINSAGATITQYLQGALTDEHIGRDQIGEDTEWYLNDQLNSVRGIIDTVGNLIYQADYDSFGNKISETNPAESDRYGFAGREYSEETGLYYNRARYYDPQLGRFISEDPIGFESEDANLYRYALNDPINNTDPSGLTAAASYGGLANSRLNKVIGTFIGSLQGFTTPSLLFIGNVLELAGPGADIDFGVALDKTKEQLKDIKRALKPLKRSKLNLASGFAKGFGIGSKIGIEYIKIKTNQ